MRDRTGLRYPYMPDPDAVIQIEVNLESAK